MQRDWPQPQHMFTMNQNVTLFFVVRISFGVAYGIWSMSVLSTYIYVLGGNTARATELVGYAEALEGVCIAAAAWSVGWLGNNVRRDRILKCAAVISLAAILLTTAAITSSSFNYLLLCMGLVLWGVTEAASPILESIFADSILPDKQSSLFHAINVCSSLTESVGLLLAALFFYIQGDQWTLPYLQNVMLAGISFSLLPALALLFFDERKTVAAKHNASLHLPPQQEHISEHNMHLHGRVLGGPEYPLLASEQDGGIPLHDEAGGKLMAPVGNGGLPGGGAPPERVKLLGVCPSDDAAGSSSSGLLRAGPPGVSFTDPPLSDSTTGRSSDHTTTPTPRLPSPAATSSTPPPLPSTPSPIFQASPLPRPTAFITHAGSPFTPPLPRPPSTPSGTCTPPPNVTVLQRGGSNGLPLGMYPCPSMDSLMLSAYTPGKISIPATSSDSDQRTPTRPPPSLSSTPSVSMSEFGTPPPGLFSPAPPKRHNRLAFLSPSANMTIHAIPGILALADCISGLASGTTKRFFPIFFMTQAALTPSSLTLLFATTPLFVFLLTLLASRSATLIGRVPTLLLFRFIGVAALATIAVLPSTWTLPLVVVPLFLTRTAAMNCCNSIQRGIQGDLAPLEGRMKWGVLDSVNPFIWAGSAAVGGLVVSRWGFSVSFIMSASLQAVAWILTALLLPLVPCDEAAVEQLAGVRAAADAKFERKLYRRHPAAYADDINQEDYDDYYRQQQQCDDVYRHLAQQAQQEAVDRGYGADREPDHDADHDGDDEGFDDDLMEPLLDEWDELDWEGEGEEGEEEGVAGGREGWEGGKQRQHIPMEAVPLLD